MDSVIKTSNLCKYFGTFKAVDDLNFEVHKGEIFAFLGANGAGKTTAIKMLCGLSLPTSGNAFIGGYDVYKDSEKIKQNIGYMSQKFSLYEDLSVFENIELFGTIYSLSTKTIRENGDSLLNFLNIYAYKNKLVKDLSLGFKQKLAFCVATLHKPKIIFLDEPTSGVDPKTRRDFWELIYKASNENISIFITTHYMDEAEYCDRVSIMIDGKIKILDTPKNLKRTYNAKDIQEIFFQLAKEAKRS
ncbi:ABC transporter ATP-binding protein [Campylobacter lari]|nr:ABC transporter ATP-binding protein [Campylobacter lari]EAK0436937.1 ABC transporter ATP-binding protein [Campylobacter lari]EAK0805204.1 ABC transporter ATP-binding protein [Campylobacter lari]EAL9771934.1 ABC transporter ATP-binding protein [Campylobacter lari]EGK7523082.1 ABC transporter ATP-binding protein [Campylobacter lari]